MKEPGVVEPQMEEPQMEEPQIEEGLGANDVLEDDEYVNEASPLELASKTESSPALPTTLTGPNQLVCWTHPMDVLLLSECQRCGPTEETFSRLSAINNASVSQVKQRLLFLMDKLEEMEADDEDDSSSTVSGYE